MSVLPVLSLHLTKVNNLGEQKKGTTETEVNDFGVNESSAFWRGLNGLYHENIAVLAQFYAGLIT